MHKDACSRFCCGAKTGMRVWQRMWSPNGFAQMQLCASWQQFGCLFRVSICSWSFKERAARWSVTREKSELLWDNTDEMSRLMQQHCTGVSTHCVYLSAGTCEETLLLLLLFFSLRKENPHRKINNNTCDKWQQRQRKKRMNKAAVNGWTAFLFNLNPADWGTGSPHTFTHVSQVVHSIIPILSINLFPMTSSSFPFFFFFFN